MKTLTAIPIAELIKKAGSKRRVAKALIDRYSKPQISEN